jgi:hypothetical protein
MHRTCSKHVSTAQMQKKHTGIQRRPCHASDTEAVSSYRQQRAKLPAGPGRGHATHMVALFGHPDCAVDLEAAAKT